jgi:hypothetical protein
MSIPEVQPVQPRPHPHQVVRKPSGNPVQALNNTAAAAGRPWWAETFNVAAVCLKVFVAPLRIASQVAEAAVAIAFVGVFGALAAWYLGIIPDEQVAKLLGELGGRGLAIIQASGVL